METNAKIVKTFPQSKTLKAVANLYIGDCFVVHGVKVIDSEKGMFIAMPSEKRGEQYRDICHPLNSETRQSITEIVLAAYNEVVPVSSVTDSGE
jgi:stage V sporulation protein G